MFKYLLHHHNISILKIIKELYQDQYEIESILGDIVDHSNAMILNEILKSVNMKADLVLSIYLKKIVQRIITNPTENEIDIPILK